MEYLEVLDVRDIDAGELHRRGRILCSLEKISVDQVGKVRMSNLLAEGVEIVWIVRNCDKIGKCCAEGKNKRLTVGLR